MIRYLRNLGFKFKLVLADSVYGESHSTFIKALKEWQLNYAVAIRSNHGVWLPQDQRVRQNRWRTFDRIFDICWYGSSSEANPGWISTTRVLSFPLVVDFLKVKVPPFMSVVCRANASDTRQPVNKQMANNALSRGVTSPSVNNCLNSCWVRTFPCPLPLTFISLALTSFQ